MLCSFSIYSQQYEYVGVDGETSGLCFSLVVFQFCLPKSTFNTKEIDKEKVTKG